MARVSILQKKAALYIRVSTKYQIDGDSLPMQRDELPKYVKYALGIEDFEIFEDAGFSAKNTDRPAFQTMMSRVRSGEFSHIVVWKLDRISRNLLDFAAMYAELKRLGVVFISKNEQFDTSTAIGEAMLKIILVFAELERNMTSERVTSTMISRAQGGQWNGGKVPFGYSYDKNTKLFSIVKDEERTVLVIYEKYEQLRSLLKVARFLNENGYKTRSGIPWNPTTVHKILTSPFYIGTYRYNYRNESTPSWGIKKPGEWILVEDHHPAIVDAARQRAIIRILEDNDCVTSFHKTYERKNVHVFGGLLTCGACGSGFQSTIDRPRSKNDWRPSIYLCSRHRRFKDCPNKYVSDVTLGPFVLNFFANYIRAQRSFGRTTDDKTLEKKLLRGITIRDGSSVSIDPESLATIRRLFMRERFGLDEYAASAPCALQEQPSNVNEREILDREQKRLERAIQRLKALYLYSEDSMPEKDFILESSNLNESLQKINDRIAELDADNSDDVITPDDEDFMQQASYLVITEELLSRRFVDYEKVLRILDKRTLKNFIVSVAQNFCILDGKVTQITFKNGLKVKFLYN